jgi:hypothetical protein
MSSNVLHFLAAAGNFDYAVTASELKATGSIGASDTTDPTGTNGGCKAFETAITSTITNLAYTGTMYLKGTILFGAAVFTDIEILR